MKNEKPICKINDYLDLDISTGGTKCGYPNTDEGRVISLIEAVHETIAAQAKDYYHSHPLLEHPGYDDQFDIACYEFDIKVKTMGGKLRSYQEVWEIAKEYIRYV